MIDLIIESFYFLLPAAFANLPPHLLGKLHLIEFLNIPLDGGKTFRQKRLLGSNKTVRGLIFGTLGGGLIGILQWAVSGVEFFDKYSVFDYSSLWPSLALGLILGLGALVGDLIKSFFKRQLEIAPGKSWFPFDQIDFIVGAYLFSFFFIILPLQYLVAMIFVYAVVHMLINSIGYLMGLNKSWI